MRPMATPSIFSPPVPALAAALVWLALWAQAGVWSWQLWGWYAALVALVCCLAVVVLRHAALDVVQARNACASLEVVMALLALGGGLDLVWAVLVLCAAATAPLYWAWAAGRLHRLWQPGALLWGGVMLLWGLGAWLDHAQAVFAPAWPALWVWGLLLPVVRYAASGLRALQGASRLQASHGERSFARTFAGPQPLALSAHSLTGVASFAQLLESVDALRERHARKPEPFCVVLLELDPWVARTRAAAPSPGLSLSEQVLLMLSGMLVTQLRAIDRVGHYQGDIFMLILPDTLLGQGVDVLKRVSEGVRRSHWRDTPTQREGALGLTLTVAVAQYQSGETAEHVVQRANAALICGRASGRDQIVVAQDTGPGH